MAQEKRNWLVDWFLLLRERAPEFRHRLGEVAGAIRENPAALWDTSVVRYTTYVGGGLILVWFVHWAVSLAVPPPPASARPEATTADFHAICRRTECGHHFVLRREFGFDGFPVACPTCKQKTGERAVRCSSQTCGGRWVIPVAEGGERRCPHCNAALP